MTVVAKLSDLELSALLCSKICHDVIGPASAVVNGLEMLEVETDETMRTEVLGMMSKSARKASAQLQFARLAFGAAGSAGSELDLADVEQLVQLIAESEKADIEWRAPGETRPKDEVKLLLNLVHIGFAAIPLGGTMTVSVSGPRLTIVCAGDRARVPEGVDAMISGDIEPGDIDARSVQAYYAGRVAQAAGLRVRFTVDGDQVSITAFPAAATA